jgi:hypothetical protein
MKSLRARDRGRSTFRRGLVMAAILVLTQQQVWAATFNVKDDPIFGKAAPVITAYAHARHAKGVNNFCVLGRLSDDGGKSAWIIWRQNREIILWEGQDLSSTPPRLLLDLDKDVVESEADLHGSSYLVTRRWASNLISECKRTGLQIAVGRHRR